MVNSAENQIVCYKFDPLIMTIFQNAKILKYLALSKSLGRLIVIV